MQPDRSARPSKATPWRFQNVGISHTSAAHRRIDELFHQRRLCHLLPFREGAEPRLHLLRDACGDEVRATHGHILKEKRPQAYPAYMGLFSDTTP
jgi:hypothetical protein